MLQRILAPTDGSTDSEKALPFAEQIALAHGAEIVLVLIVDQPALPVGRGSSGETAETEAVAHLAAIETRWKAAGIRVRSVVQRGPTAATLLDLEQAEKPDLLVIATHGRTGLARFAMGSVADRMIREGSVPVLVIRRSAESSSQFRSAMVLLDGSPFGEAVVGMTGQLAGAPLQAITLLRVVASPEDRGEAESYLRGVARQLATGNLEPTIRVEAGDTRRVIESSAHGHDLVILSTHGRGGFDRLRHGSVADYLVRYLDEPVLLVRAHDIPDFGSGAEFEPKFSEVLEAQQHG